MYFGIAAGANFFKRKKTVCVDLTGLTQDRWRAPYPDAFTEFLKKDAKIDLAKVDSVSIHPLAPYCLVKLKSDVYFEETLAKVRDGILWSGKGMVTGFRCDDVFTEVKIFGVSPETDKQDVQGFMQAFGEVIGGIRVGKVKGTNIPDGTFYMRMILTESIPYLVPHSDEGEMWVVRHEGQDSTCFKCFGTGHMSKDCEDQPNQFGKECRLAAKAWKELLLREAQERREAEAHGQILDEEQQAEQARLQAEQTERARLAAQQLELDQAEQVRLADEQDRLAEEQQAERDRLAAQQLEQDQAAEAEQARLAEQDRLAEEQAERDRLAREQAAEAEHARLAQEQAVLEQEQAEAEQARLAEVERLAKMQAEHDTFMEVSSQASVNADLNASDPLDVDKTVDEIKEQENEGHSAEGTDKVSTNPEDLIEKEDNQLSKKQAKKDRQKQAKKDVEDDIKKRKASPISPPKKENRRASLSGGLVPLISVPYGQPQVSATPVNKTMLPKGPMLSHTPGLHQVIPPTLLQLKSVPNSKKITKENRTGL